jgi:mRNA-degrading endonuclease YafQ of YafQ-DinJ toxin-antitoxin module
MAILYFGFNDCHVDQDTLMIEKYVIHYLLLVSQYRP